MPTIYRLTKAKYQETAFQGIGSMRGAGRWHMQGIRVVYASDMPSTALLEVLVHAHRTDLINEPYVLFPITFDEKRHLLELPEATLPPDWQTWPWSLSTQELGTFWYQRRDSPLLRVPSAVVPLQGNYLINVEHPRFEELHIGDPLSFELDQRLVSSGIRR